MTDPARATDLTLTFTAESLRGLDRMAENLGQLRGADRRRRATEFLWDLRALRADCEFLGLVRTWKLAHAAESVASALREGHLPPTAALVELLLDTVERLRASVLHAAEHRVEADLDVGDFVSALASALLDASPPPPTPLRPRGPRPEHRLGELLQRVRPVVDKLSRRLDKRVRVVCDAADVEIDRALVATLWEPLLQVVRNALEHGIERPPERDEAGKSPEATLTIRATADGGVLRIAVIDDGRGIPLGEAEGSRAPIFEPGFTTAPRIHDRPGRGSGLDRVRASIESIGGTVAAESEAGVGTAFRLWVPLTDAQSTIRPTRGRWAEDRKTA